MPNTENSTEQSYFSKVEPLSHFFIEPGAFTQNASKAFGPVSGTETEQYRLTTKFTVSAQPKAFAICKGTVLVQPQTGSTTKVNLILKPFIQPIQGISIKYFIYRGLLLSDFFSGDNVLADTATSSDYIKKINEDFRNFHEGSTSMPVFKAKFVGYNPTAQANSLLLDSLFFKKTEFHEVNGVMVEDVDTAFELPMIDMGKYLGRFATGDCGLDIVINYGDYKLPEGNDDEFTFTLGYARGADAILDLTGDTDTFRRKRKREHIYQFLDAAAFFGFHCCEKGIVVADNAGTKQQKKGTQIYTDLLQPFVTKNKLYLYIQSDRGRSYNFYGNYAVSDTNTNCIKYGASETSLNESKFLTSEWPLLILEETQNHLNSKNRLCLQFVTDNNNDACLYAHLAELETAKKNNFITDDLLNSQDNSSGETTLLTNVISILSLAVSNNGNKNFISSFCLLIYHGKVLKAKIGEALDSNNVSISKYIYIKSSANIFKFMSPILNNGIYNYTSVSALDKLNCFPFKNGNKKIGFCASRLVTITDKILKSSSGTANYLDRLTYISEPVDVFSTSISGTNSFTLSLNVLTTSKFNSNDSTNVKDFKPQEPLYYEISTFEDNNTITGLRLLSRDKTTSNKLIVGISEFENNLLSELLTNNFFNVWLYFHPCNSFTLELSNDNKIFKKYYLLVIAENEQNELEVLSYNDENILIYSADNHIFFSEEYTKYMFTDESNKYFGLKPYII